MRAFLTKPIPRPPTVVRAAAAIVLGVATTVAVAWGLAFFMNGSQRNMVNGLTFGMDTAFQLVPTPPEFAPDGVYFAQVTHTHCWGTNIVNVGLAWGNVGEQSYGSPSRLVEGTSFAGEMKEKFSRGEAPTAQWRADGWPFLALSAETRWWRSDAHGLEKVVDGVLVGSRHVPANGSARILPLRPMWTGFVIDSALYASLWFGLFSLGSIRRIRPALRRRRGLCPGCGYKLQPEQTRCSECGEPVARR